MRNLYNASEIREVGDVEDTRTVQFIISDDSKDRHGTVLNMDGWNLENFNNNGIVGYQHDVYGGGMCKGPDPDSVIGKGRAWLDADFREGRSSTVLMGEIQFEPKEINELAEKIFRKVLHGTLKATSVGFKPIGGGTLVNEENGNEKELDEPPRRVPKGHTFYYEAQELLEFSVVNIPSNPNALKRDLRDQTANALRFVREQLGKGFTYGDIENMKVRDVIKMLEQPENRNTIGEMIGEEKESEIKEKSEEIEQEEIQDTAREGTPERNKRQLITIKTKQV